MAHEVESMAYAGEVPWHGLGTKVPANLSAYEMLKAADLDWKVKRVPNLIKWNGEYKETGDFKLVRDTDGKIFDNISEGWNEIQNHEAADFFYDFVEEGKMEMHTAGSLRGGAFVWFLAKVKESFTLGGKDHVDAHLLFTVPHQYGAATFIGLTPIRVVCMNTLRMALSRRGEYNVRISHATKFDPEIVKETLGLTHTKMDEFKEMAAFLSKRKASKDQVEEFLKSVFPAASEDKLSRPAKTVLDVLETQPGAEFFPGTWWNAFNGITYAIDHLLGQSTDTRLTSAWYGVNKAKKLTALDKALEMAS